MTDTNRRLGWVGSIFLIVTLASPATAQTTDAAVPSEDAGVALPVTDTDTDADSDTDTDADSDADSDTDTDADADTDSEADAAEPDTLGAPTADTGIRGRVVDSTTGEGLPDAIVIARTPRLMENTITNGTGGYVLVIPPGIYSVLSYTDLYHGARMPRVVVRSGRFSDLTLTLDPIDAEAVAEEIEIVYRADTSSTNAQDQLRAASSGIGEGMGAQQMSRAGASDAGSAARNVVGVSLEGQNLNIRGLGGRYTMVLLNGIQLPSTDPDFPSVDLDLFPTSIIDNLQISKTFLPNMPASFAGGVLDIRTVRFPREFTLHIGLNVGANTLSSFQDRLDYQGGGLDWLGVDDGTRALPSGLENDPVVTTRGGPYTSSAQLETIAERFPNIWQYTRALTPPNFGLNLTLGDSTDLGGGNRFGYLVTAFYDHSDVRTLGLRRWRPTNQDGELTVRNDYEAETGSEEVQIGALGTASLELGQSDVITFLTLFNRSTTDETQRTTGISTDLGGQAERWQLQYIARSLWFNQLRGDHRNMFGTSVRLRWTLYGSYGAREEPDRRTVTYGFNGGSSRWLEKAQSGERFYSDLDQGEGGGNLELRFPLWSEGWGTVGGDVRLSQRDFAIRRLRMLQDPTNMDQSAYQQPVEDLFSPQGIGTLTRIREYTREDDSYHSEQGYYAAFAMLETPLGDALSFTGGARFEAFQQLVQSQSPFAAQNESMPPTEDSRTDRTDIDVLPAAALRLELADQMFLRAGYGMTVARPQAREVAPYQYYDFVRDRNVQGNPELARTLIQNADLRWEWFFGEGEILALSAFYKYFDRPIELQIINQESYDSQYINADFAHNVGGEVEVRFNLRHLHNDLRFFSVNANAALVWSTVSLPDELSGAVQSERPLFGQAPYVANVSLAFDEPDSGVTASLVYNVVGPRVSDVGTRAGSANILPNVVRAPFHSLDLVVGWRVVEHLRLGLRLRNILFQAQEYYQDDFLVDRTETGMSGSLSFTYEH